MQQRTAAKAHGIDLSHWNGEVDWAKLKGKVDFVYLKASEGSAVVDPMFAKNVKGAKSVNIPVGAYHFAEPDKSDAAGQAENFVKAMKECGLTNFGELMPVLDLETPQAKDQPLSVEEITTWALTFIETVKKLTNRPVMLYTGLWYIKEFAGFDNKLGSLPLWIAIYDDNPIPNIGGWTNWTMYQYTEKGQIDGVPGSVDLDVAMSLAELTK